MAPHTAIRTAARHPLHAEQADFLPIEQNLIPAHGELPYTEAEFRPAAPGAERERVEIRELRLPQQGVFQCQARMEPAILKKDVLRQHRAPCPIQDGKLLQLRLFSEQRCVDCELRTASACGRYCRIEGVIRQSFTSRRSFCRNSTARISPPSSAQSKSPCWAGPSRWARWSSARQCGFPLA